MEKQRELRAVAAPVRRGGADGEEEGGVLVRRTQALRGDRALGSCPGQCPWKDGSHSNSNFVFYLVLLQLLKTALSFINDPN